MVTEWGVQQWLQVFEEQARMFRDAVGRADLTAPVPTCPGWTFTELTVHVGRFLQVVTGQLRSGSVEQQVRPEPAPEAPEPLAYLDEQLAVAREVLGATPANRPVWTFSPTAPRLAWVWHRRVAHELTIRRWDAQAALGDLVPLDRDLALDGVEEVLGTLLAARLLGDMPVAVSGNAAVVCEDAAQGWLVEFTPEQAPVVRLVPPGMPTDPDQGMVQAEVRGRASSVYLGLWGRIELPGRGDRGVLHALRVR